MAPLLWMLPLVHVQLHHMVQNKRKRKCVKLFCYCIYIYTSLEVEYLMVRVLILHSERSSSSDNSSNARVVHVVLPIAITWRGIDKPTPKTPFFIQQKKKKKGIYNFILVPPICQSSQRKRKHWIIVQKFNFH